ncbi:PopZ family protein [Martelella limonii]|uniref:PopZ family protein n=1 Tax=Martelella limonii TaxID=1647649 RepID=UPI0015802A0E|nr:DUF2497 domain-containing protein [Martelella limonii]
MAQPKMQQEPTMEEILASIRRIIDSGEDISRSPRGRDNAAGRDDGRYRQPAQQDEERLDEDRASAHQDPEPLNEAGFVSRRPAFMFEQPEDNEGEQTAERFEQQIYDAPADIQPETAEVQVERHDVYPGTIGEVARQVREATGGEPPAQQAPESVEPPRAEGDPLLSSGSEQRIGEALGVLSDALEREGARRIEEIVVSELRPLLREWIDENMPSIVEEMVAKEIERMRNARR